MKRPLLSLVCTLVLLACHTQRVVLDQTQGLRHPRSSTACSKETGSLFKFRSLCLIPIATARYTLMQGSKETKSTERRGGQHTTKC